MLHFLPGILHESSGVAVTKKIVKVGLRVVRGKDWDSGDEDGNGKGTVIEKCSGCVEGVWKVQWDVNGLVGTYRVGYNEDYELYTA